MAEQKSAMPLPRGPGAGPRSYERPKDFKASFSRILSYLGRSKALAALILLLLLVSSAAMLAGSYFINRPVVWCSMRSSVKRSMECRADASEK